MDTENIADATVSDTSDTHEEKSHCTAFCPLCGFDLTYFEHKCFCKNPNCKWECEGCGEDVE